MPEYINPNAHAVHLTGQDGKTIRIESRQRISLPDYFDRYRQRGFIKLVTEYITDRSARRIQAKINLTNKRPIFKPLPQAPNIGARAKRREEISRARKLAKAQSNKSQDKPTPKPSKAQIVNKFVGRALKADPTKILQSNLEKYNYPISNNIGIGILSYNRRHSLERLVNSIMEHTNLKKTTVFISDDCSSDANTIEYLERISQNGNIVVIRNDSRIGIAGNTNRLLKCLSRFDKCILLNDDVEVISHGWEHFYFEAMRNTSMHHFIFRQPGIYGSTIGQEKDFKGIKLRLVNDKPQGAILAFTSTMLSTCGYFNEEYGLYGMEHVDWSMKAWEFGLQQEGFYDVYGSEKYFILHPEQSAVENRQELLRKAKKEFESRSAEKYVTEVKLPEISYILPFRDIGRTNSINTVVNNVRAQKFPVINIILSEQDDDSKINISDFQPVQYVLSKSEGKPFNKSMAFNRAASIVSTDRVIMHDADILLPSHYTGSIYDILEHHTGCHVGNVVIYADQASSSNINSTSNVDEKSVCDRVVGYFEGGSLACHMSTYWQCGGFNEDFWGYGCEDCDFYSRLMYYSHNKWYEVRTFDFLHLWHGRVDGWDDHHETNKRIESELKRRSVDDRINLQRSQLRKLGYGRFLDG